jgi:hypothetical protein
MMNLMTPVSPGELLDKLTILEIKSERIQDPEKLINIRHELELLEAVWRQADQGSETVRALRSDLKQVNEMLWVIEDDIRLCENEGNFGDRFIELARSVYITNDRRADLKKQINLALGSAIVEEKSYQDYRGNQ